MHLSALVLGQGTNHEGHEVSRRNAAPVAYLSAEAREEAGDPRGEMIPYQ